MSIHHRSGRPNYGCMASNARRYYHERDSSGRCALCGDGPEIPASPVSAATPQQTAALQALADQAQELDMGYGQPDSSAASGEALAQLLTRIDDAHEGYERYGQICQFEGQPMIYASTLHEIIELRGKYHAAPQATTPLPEQDERATLEVIKEGVAELLHKRGGVPQATASNLATAIVGYVSGKIAALTQQAAPVALLCQWPTCQPEGVQQQIAKEVADSLYGAAPVASASDERVKRVYAKHVEWCVEQECTPMPFKAFKKCTAKALEAPVSEQQTDQAHVLPPFAAPAGQHEASFAVLSAVRDGIPLQEPVNITKAVLAQREARVVLSGGKGPEACVMLVNIQITGWAEGSEKAEAFASGYNTAFKWYRGALLDLANKVSADAASRFRVQGGNTNDDSGDSTAATTASVSGERLYTYEQAQRHAKEAVEADRRSRAPAPSREADELLRKLADAADVLMKGGVAPVRQLIDKARAFLAQQGATQAAPASEKGEGNG